MKKFYITVSKSITGWFEVENEDIAVDMALEDFEKKAPDIFVEEEEED